MQIKKVICVDIDGILNTGESKIEEEQPNWDNIIKINNLFSEGHQIILFTSRDITLRNLTKKWLERYSVHYHDIIFNKPRYDIFIDDKATNNIEEVLKYVQSI